MTSETRLREAIIALDYDPHNYSKRGCPTCERLTDALGEPFGCIRYRMTGEMARPLRDVFAARTKGEPR